MSRRFIQIRFLIFCDHSRGEFHCTKRFAVVQEEGPAERLFEKEPDPNPPEIQNFTVPTSSPGDHIESGTFDASNRVEYIALVRNQGLEVDYGMESDPENFPLVDTPAAEKLFEVKTWG